MYPEDDRGCLGAPQVLVFVEWCLGCILGIIPSRRALTVSIRHALLALLAERPKYGLQLRQEFEARTGEVWPLNVGQVYTTLARLERDGMVQADNVTDGAQKEYRLTDIGDAELIAWLHTPPALSAPPRDELVMKVLIAARLPGVDVTGLVQAHRRQLVEAMRHYTRIKEDLVPNDTGAALIADAEIFRIDAVIRWLDSAEARLRRASRGHERAVLPGRPAGHPANSGVGAQR
jgi:DNA-binding PadR family transcriptional regulator